MLSMELKNKWEWTWVNDAHQGTLLRPPYMPRDAGCTTSHSTKSDVPVGVAHSTDIMTPWGALRPEPRAQKSNFDAELMCWCPDVAKSPGVE